MSSIEAGQIRIVEDDFDPHLLFEDVKSMFKMQMVEKALEFTVIVDEDVPAALNGDKRRIKQIMINLVGNALKFTERGGIYVTCKVTGSTGSKISLQMDVKDTGSGIDPQDQERIFDAFEQTDEGLKGGKGTGLGLPLSRHFAREMGGDITISSQKGIGSTFQIIIICDEASNKVGDTAMNKRVIYGVRPNSDIIRILVVDDIEENRLYLTTMLEKIGFEIRSCTNGEETLVITEQWKPEIILMDAIMPVMDGQETIKHLSKNPELRDIPIIIISASILDEDVNSVLDAGAVGFLPKPVNQHDLLTEIGEHISVDYVFETGVDDIEEPDMSVTEYSFNKDILPKELVSRMKNAAQELNITEMAILIEEVEQYDKEMAEKLSKLLDNFDWLEIERNFAD